MDEPDLQLAGRLAQGDESAFCRLYDTCADSLHHYLTVILQSRDDADDVLQETFKRLTQTRRKLRGVKNVPDISPTTQVRLGMEYLFILEKTVIPLRCGVFYDPEPSDGTPDDFFGITLGSGVLYKNLVFDLSYQYRFGHDVREVELGGSSSSMDVEEHQIFFSLIIYLHGINKAG